jgi:hypothetical protein
MAETREPSARPWTFGMTAFMTCPMACGPSAPDLGDGGIHRGGQFGVAELCRQVGLVDRCLGFLSQGLVLATTVAERRGGFTPTLGLRLDQPDDRVVVQFALWGPCPPRRPRS